MHGRAGDDQVVSVTRHDHRQELNAGTAADQDAFGREPRTPRKVASKTQGANVHVGASRHLPCKPDAALTVRNGEGIVLGAGSGRHRSIGLDEMSLSVHVRRADVRITIASVLPEYERASSAISCH